MATVQMDRVIRHIRRTLILQDEECRTDAQLLAAFINQKDDDAFSALAHRHTNPPGAKSGGIGLLRNLPKTRFVMHAESGAYARKANRITIRHPDGDVVAVVEIVSPGNKDSRHVIRDFSRKAVAFLHAGINLLIVNLFPPSKRDPQSIHKVIWD